MDPFQSFCEYLLFLMKEEIKFTAMTEEVKSYVERLGRAEVVHLLKEIGAIPENILASSSGEKLYSKASDIILSRAFQELGLTSIAITERKDSADIQAQSIHGYSLVADAKTFRLSRTAKNQKDYKISNLSNWRGRDYNFAVLVAPYFQYPKTNSQIYSSALDRDVCLLSWEHMAFMIEGNIRENPSFSLEAVWSSSARILRDSRIAFAGRKNYLFPYINKMICDRMSVSVDEFDEYLLNCKNTIIKRSNGELLHLRDEIAYIKSLSRSEAIDELIKSRKLNERISTIQGYIASLDVTEE